MSPQKLIMMNTFRDRLMTTHFDIFKSLIEEINQIKTDLKNQKRRVNKPIGTYIAYDLIKQVSAPLSKIFNYKRYGLDTSIQMFKTSLVKFHLLIREMQEYDRNDLTDSLIHIYNRLFNLLPQSATVQHSLFDPDNYQSKSKKSIQTTGFLEWLQDYVLMGFQKRDINRKRWGSKFVEFTQPSLKLRWS